MNIAGDPRIDAKVAALHFDMLEVLDLAEQKVGDAAVWVVRGAGRRGN